MNTSPTTVPGTTTLGAALGPWACIVVGAGPAGAATSLRLAREGLRVLLVDRGGMPRGKVCGCCLSPVAIGELARLALPLAAGVPIPLATLALSSGGWTARVAVGGGGVLSRETLDTAIVEAAVAAGVDWLPGVDVVSVTTRDGNAVSVTLRSVADGAVVTIGADRCVLATGLVDRVRGDTNVDAIQERRGPGAAGKRCMIGLGTTLPADCVDLPPGELRMMVGRQGYCGIVRLEDGRIDVAAAIDRAAVRGGGGAAGAVLAVLGPTPEALSPRLADALHAARYTATPPLTRRFPPSAEGGLILRVGDAAAYVEPFTGEGIGWALASARIAADTILQAACGARVGEVYAGAHHRHFVVPHARCRRVTSWLQSPALVTAAVASARIAPGLAARIVPLFIGAGGRGGQR
jgi:flavin-dependent dehydrogenase